MTKKYYSVEFNIAIGAWGEDENEAYETACARVKGVSHLSDLIWNYDDCVTEAEGDWDYDDPDAPEMPEPLEEKV